MRDMPLSFCFKNCDIKPPLPKVLAARSSPSNYYYLSTLSLPLHSHTLLSQVEIHPLLLATLSTMKFIVLNILCLLVTIPAASALLGLGLVNQITILLGQSTKALNAANVLLSFPTCAVRSSMLYHAYFNPYANVDTIPSVTRYWRPHHSAGSGESIAAARTDHTLIN